MKDLLTTFSSIMIILFCFSLFFLSGETDSTQGISHGLSNSNLDVQTGKNPFAKKMLFKRVQSVKMQKGVLMFVTLEEGEFKEHYIMVRNKNVILIRKSASDMPHDSILFDDDGHNTLLITIPTTFDINLMDAMASISHL